MSFLILICPLLIFSVCYCVVSTASVFSTQFISYMIMLIKDTSYMISCVSCACSGFIRGPGDNPKPIAFSFHDKFKQGPLLSVVHILLFNL